MKELNPNKPVQLRDGRQVRNVCWDYLLSNGMIGISAIVRTTDGQHDYQGLWYSNGIAYTGIDSQSLNLINVPERIQGWLNIYNIYKHPTKQDADNNAGNGRVACIYIDISEGGGLE